MFGESGLAQALKKALQLGQMGRVVAHRRPIGASAGDGERRVEREPGPDPGTRLVQSTKPRERDAQHKMWMRIISVGLDCPSEPRNRLVVKAGVVLRHARGGHPGVSMRIARTEAQRLDNMSLGLFGAADVNLTKADRGMGLGEISIERQRMFTFGDAPRRALGVDVTIPSVIWPRAWSGTEDRASVNFASAAKRAAAGSVPNKLAPATVSARADPISASTLSGSADDAGSKKLRARATLSGVIPLLNQAKP